ncbi:hypothetical protein AK812_SmicGene29601 [Symbiodinium microadriaticum]|uniref:Uncharacterized protein n=1 Tax=Symbiodinium microadriaticum TaxID=2951 RepID=A0A1Q9D1E3_SYMMI|nr:hypothetical protein AK812_SmicGene29601 [Symbiodinium microadriaticum]
MFELARWSPSGEAAPEAFASASEFLVLYQTFSLRTETAGCMVQGQPPSFAGASLNLRILQASAWCVRHLNRLEGENGWSCFSMTTRPLTSLLAPRFQSVSCIQVKLCRLQLVPGLGAPVFSASLTVAFDVGRLDSLKALKAGAVVKVFPSFQERWEEHMQTGGPEEGHDVRHLLDAMLADARPSFIPASQQALTQHRSGSRKGGQQSDMAGAAVKEEGHDVRHLLDAMLSGSRPSFIPASQQALTQHRSGSRKGGQQSDMAGAAVKEEGHDVRHLLDAMLSGSRPSFIPASQQALTQHRSGSRKGGQQSDMAGAAVKEEGHDVRHLLDAMLSGSRPSFIPASQQALTQHRSGSRKGGQQSDMAGAAVKEEGHDVRHLLDAMLADARPSFIPASQQVVFHTAPVVHTPLVMLHSVSATPVLFGISMKEPLSDDGKL